MGAVPNAKPAVHQTLGLLQSALGLPWQETCHGTNRRRPEKTTRHRFTWRQGEGCIPMIPGIAHGEGRRFTNLWATFNKLQSPTPDSWYFYVSNLLVADRRAGIYNLKLYDLTVYVIFDYSCVMHFQFLWSKGETACSTTKYSEVCFPGNITVFLDPLIQFLHFVHFTLLGKAPLLGVETRWPCTNQAGGVTTPTANSTCRRTRCCSLQHLQGLPPDGTGGLLIRWCHSRRSSPLVNWHSSTRKYPKMKL